MKAKDLMINCKSLMIGDFISYHGKKYQVRGIKEDNDGIYRCLVDDDNHFGWWLKIEDIQPIPLTPEILEKNGFVYNDLPFVQAWEQFGLSIYGTQGHYRINCGQNVVMDVSCIHQLQQALRLCGIDKDIIL